MLTPLTRPLPFACVDSSVCAVNINLVACINGTRLAYKAMKSNGAAGGVIINISSVLGLQPQGSNPLYAASKHGLVGFTRSLAHLAREGVRVNTLSPGYAETTLVTQGMGDLKMTPETMEVIQGIKDAGGMMAVNQVAEGAMILIEDNTLAGMVRGTDRRQSRDGGTRSRPAAAACTYRTVVIAHLTDCSSFCHFRPVFFLC